MQKTLTPRQQKLAERKAAQVRSEAVKAAVADEMTRFNAALADGKTAILPTAFGPYRVQSVNSEWWYCCYPAESKSNNWLSQRSFAGCNDGDWADLLAQVGVARNPFFVK